MTISIEDAIERFAAAKTHGGHLALNQAHGELVAAIKHNRETMPASAVPDLSIPGLSVEVWICTRCERYRIEHYVATLARSKDACDAFISEDLSEQESAEAEEAADVPPTIGELRTLLSSMRAAGGDWEDTADVHRKDAGLADDAEDWQESLSGSDRIRYEYAEEDAALDIMNNLLPGWIKQLSSVIAAMEPGTTEVEG